MQLTRTTTGPLAGAFLLGATAIAVAQVSETQGVTANEVKIGAFGAFSGPAYLYGKISMNGTEAVFDKVNESGGIHGRKLVLIREDDPCRPEAAIAAVKKLVYDTKVFALMGGGCSNSTLAARPEIERSGVPFVVTASTADAITHPVAKNIFTVQLTATTESRAQLDYAIAKGAKKIAVVAMRDAWGAARYEPLMKYVAEKKITLVENLELQGDAVDATPQALRLRSAGADAVILVLFPKPAAVLMRDALKLGFNPTWIGQSTISDLKSFEGQVGLPGALRDFVTISTTRFNPADPVLKEWDARIKKLFPQDELSPYNLYGLGGAQFLVEAMKNAGPDLTHAKLLDAMGKIKGFKSDAYFGPITCNAPTSHQCNGHPGWFAYRNGAVVEVN
jgi:branched-chain amino acid transport system substrate-binding protein